MTDELYGSPSLCVRELLQNAMDALRHRKAVIKRDSRADWTEGKVEMWHSVDSNGHEVVRCVDNGIGMDQFIVERFLTNVGRSYYRSSEFEQERISFRTNNIDFDPCAQFGIGFMSCFMLGDRITIHTRRDNGPNVGRGEPLLIEINGLGGIVVIRPGLNDQPVGTRIEITGRKKPRFFDVQDDRVKLIKTLKTFAVNSDFPIEAHCEIEEIASSISIAIGWTPPQTLVEKLGIQECITFEQSFSEIHPNLLGCIRASFLTDANGGFTLATSEAMWEQAQHPYDDLGPGLLLPGENVPLTKSSIGHDCIVAIDGIKVAYDYDDDSDDISPIPNGFQSHLLDIRGEIKPSLTPSRTPPNKISGSGWNYILQLVQQSHGRLWENIIRNKSFQENPKLIWELGILYCTERTSCDVFMFMGAQSLWDNMSVPIVRNDIKHCEWKHLSELSSIVPVPSYEIPHALKSKGATKASLECTSVHGLKIREGIYISASPELAKWCDASDYETTLRCLVTLMSTLTVHNNIPVLKLSAPKDANWTPDDFLFITDKLYPTRNSYTPNDYAFAIPYEGEVNDFIAVHFECRSVNRNAPLIQFAAFSQYSTDLEIFANNMVSCLSDRRNVRMFTNPPKRLNRYYREIGQRFLDINWDNEDKSFRPPYKVRLTDGSTINITENIFKNWADAQPEIND
jgi:hypothetical protein